MVAPHQSESSIACGKFVTERLEGASAAGGNLTGVASNEAKTRSLLLGVVEALTAGYLSTEYKDVMAFALLIGVLLFMPTGILGRPEVEKV